MVLLIFLSAALFLITAFILFDRILRFQYQSFREEWEKQGKAIGFGGYRRVRRYSLAVFNEPLDRSHGLLEVMIG